MNLKWRYWIVKGALHPARCDEIIKTSKSEKEVVAYTSEANETKTQEEVLKDIKALDTRNSNVVWLNKPWINKLIEPYLRSANEQAGWNFNINVVENTQFTIYNVGQHYTWHVDQFEDPFKSQTILNGKTRKLSTTLLLNDDFEGGEFVFDFTDLKYKLENTIEIVEMKKGDIIVFPSFVHHKVNPVTKGTRYSAVQWWCGDPFR